MRKAQWRTTYLAGVFATPFEFLWRRVVSASKIRGVSAELKIRRMRLRGGLALFRELPQRSIQIAR